MSVYDSREFNQSLSRTGSHASFDEPAILHSLREHQSLYSKMVEREKQIEQEFQDRLFKNKPICKFLRRRAEKSKRIVRRLETRLLERIEEVLNRAQDIVDKKRGKYFVPVHNHTDVEQDAFEARNKKQSADGGDDPHSFIRARSASRKAQCTKLYALASASSSTTILHSRRARNVSLSTNREDPETQPQSVEIVDLVPHHTQLNLHRDRGMSNVSENTLAALIQPSEGSTTSHRGSLASIWAIYRGSFGSNGQTSNLCERHKLRSALTSSMRRRNVGGEESAAATPSLISLVSTRASSLSLGNHRTKRVLSIAYADGNTAIEEPVTECDGSRKTSTVAIRYGEGIDEIIPGKKRALSGSCGFS